MHSFTGTLTLLKMACRRDRIRIPAWVACILVLVGASASANADMFNSLPERVEYAVASASSVVSRLLAGPMWGTKLGSIIMMETFVWASLLVAFLCSSTVIRHTRQNEETGRSEMIRATSVGHNAPLASALMLAMGSSLLVGLLVALVLKAVVGELSVASLAAYGASAAGVGILFSGVAAIAAQLVVGARTANGISAAIIGATFLLRGLGDILGKTNSTGVEVVSNWISWLSPFGWGHLMRPFYDIHWWVLGLYVGFAAVLVYVALELIDRRDDGAGIFAARRGAAHASPRLLSTLGLAWRLQRGVFTGWAVTMSILGLVLGIAGKEFMNMFKDNPDMKKFFDFADASRFTDALFAVLLGYASLALTGYIVQVLSRLRSEETGTLGSLLATGVGRVRWAMSHILVAAVGAAVLMVCSGVLTAAGYGLSMGEWGSFWGIVRGSVVQIPALLAVVGFLVAIFALLPRLLVAIGWSTVIFLLFIKQLGPLLELPQWVMNLSPIEHVPAVPAVAVNFTPLLWLSTAAFALTLAGLIIFRRRDINTY